MLKRGCVVEYQNYAGMVTYAATTKEQTPKTEVEIYIPFYGFRTVKRDAIVHHQKCQCVTKGGCCASS